MPLAERALREPARGRRRARSWRSPATAPRRLRRSATCSPSERRNPRYAEHGEHLLAVVRARRRVARGCYIVNSDVLFEDEIARRLVAAAGSAVLCGADHGVDQESMKAVVAETGGSATHQGRARRAESRVHRADARIDPRTARCWPRSWKSSSPGNARRLLRGRDRGAGRARSGRGRLGGRPRVGRDRRPRRPRAGARRDARASGVSGRRAGARRPAPAALSVWRRYMELPRYLRAVRGRRRARGDAGASSPPSSASNGSRSSAARPSRAALARGARGRAPAVGRRRVQVAGKQRGRGRARLRRRPRSDRRDALVAVGGGKTIDVAKSACELAGRPVIVVPTQLTADGIASPVSVDP